MLYSDQEQNNNTCHIMDGSLSITLVEKSVSKNYIQYDRIYLKKYKIYK